MSGDEAMWKAAFAVGLGAVKSVAVWGYKKITRKDKPVLLDEIKKSTQVLFIDDESFTGLIENIRQAGWNVNELKEVLNIDAEPIKQADIIFVDYKDVGTVLTPSEEGIGLVKALKSKYPHKHIIFYSGHAGFIPGHEVHGIADGWIPKNSDAYVYIERIEQAAVKMYGKR